MAKQFSTKHLQVIEDPVNGLPGVGQFSFTDDYSVFHYGKMPDQIPGKGESIARVAAFNFELFGKAGIPNHFRRYIEPNKMEFTLLETPVPGEVTLDLNSVNYMIPLQIVFRNSLPPGSSIFRRLDQGTLSLTDIGLSKLPAAGEPLENPIIEFTTKREEIDRFVLPEEAKSIAGLTESELTHIRELTLSVNEVITCHAENVGLEHADGKVEFGMLDRGDIILVDNAGTADENRFLYQGEHVGKQVMRDHYLSQGLEQNVQELAKKNVPRLDWPEPASLPPGFLDPLSEMYKAFSELWIGESLWEDVKPLDEVMETIRLVDSGAVRW